jgi:beta-aspartyl-peptidase (threonine type)
MVKPVIMVHGGAWGIPDNQVKDNLSGVEVAAKRGWIILKNNGSALDAVEVAVKCMEDNPIFDAGIGSVLTEDGTIEMDALIMDGRTLEAGARAHQVSEAGYGENSSRDDDW